MGKGVGNAGQVDLKNFLNYLLQNNVLCLTIFHKGNNRLFLSQIEKGTPMLKRNYKTARECAVLAHYSAAQTVIDDVSDKPTPSEALWHELDRISEFERSGGAVLWSALMMLPPERFNIPCSFPCAARFIYSISGEDLIGRLEFLRARLSAENPSVRPVYLNWVIRAVLRAGYALSHEREFRDVLMFAGLPSDPDMLETLYPNGTNLPDGLEIIE